MECRRAKQGEYIINLNTGEIKKARWIYTDGSALIGEAFPLFSDSPVLICWGKDEYLVIEEDEALSLLI